MKNYKEKLMSKNGIAITNIAKDYISHNLGDRIDTIAQMSEKYNLARGTIQSAIKFLSDIGAIRIVSKGHLGSFIEEIDYNILWEISGNSNVVGVMPLPYSKRYEGLATGLYKSFANERINFSLAFMRGSIKRMSALSLGIYSFAIVSKLAAQKGMELYDNLSIAYEFSKYTYVSNHGIIFRKGLNKIENNLRAAIDNESIDQKILTKLECNGFDIEYVNTPYNQILRKIELGEIDFAVWNIDEIDIKKNEVNIKKLESEYSLEFLDKDTIATIVINNEFREVFASMLKLIDIKEVEKTQLDVIEGKMIPMY